MSFESQTPLPIVCRICNQRVIDHFRPDGTWQGCIELPSPRVLIVPELRLVRIPGAMGQGTNAAIPLEAINLQYPPPRMPVPGGRTARVKYQARKASDGAMKKLHGQVRQIFVILNESEDGMTAREMIEQTGIGKPSVQHALWKLKKDGLVKVVSPDA